MKTSIYAEGHPLTAETCEATGVAMLNTRVTEALSGSGVSGTAFDVHLYRYETGVRHAPPPSTPMPPAKPSLPVETNTTVDVARRAVVLSRHALAWTALDSSLADATLILPAPPAWASACHRPTATRWRDRRVVMTVSTPPIDIPCTQGEDSLKDMMEAGGLSTLFACGTLHNAEITVGFQETAEGARTLMLGGFYQAEAWGAWSRTTTPWIALPVMLEGEVSLSITCMGLGKNLDRDITLTLGNHTQTLRLTASPSTHVINARLTKPCNILAFDGIIAEKIPGVADTRTMGIGLLEIALQSHGQQTPGRVSRWLKRLFTASPKASFEHDGYLYLSTIDPDNPEENWQDLVTAFCDAFRQRQDVALVLRTVTTVSPGFLADYVALLHASGHRACRIYLIKDSHRSAAHLTLLKHAHYCVTARRADAMCFDLLDATTAGMPLIAPMHTSLNDLQWPDGSLIVRSEPEPCSLPGDHAGPFYGYRHRIDWQSLRECLLASANQMGSGRLRDASVSGDPQSSMATQDSRP